MTMGISDSVIRKFNQALYFFHYSLIQFMRVSQKKTFTLNEPEVKSILLEGLKKSVKKGVPDTPLDKVKMVAETGGDGADVDVPIISITLEFPEETQDTNANG